MKLRWWINEPEPETPRLHEVWVRWKDDEVVKEFLRFRLGLHKKAMLQAADDAWNAAIDDLARSMNTARR